MKTPHQISASLVELLLGLMISRFLFQSRELSPVLWWTITHGLLDGLMQAETQAQAPSSDESQAQAQSAAGAKRPTGPIEDLRAGNVGRSLAWAAFAGMLMFAPWCLPMFGDTLQICLMCAVTLASLGVRRTHDKALEAGSAVGAIVDGVWMGGMLSNPLRAIGNGLWRDLPTTAALTSATYLWPRAASQVVDWGVDTALPHLGLTLSDARKEVVRPWAKAAARLPFYCMPRVVVTKSGLIMQYPPLEGHIVQHGPNFEVHQRGPWVIEKRERPEVTGTPVGVKLGQVTREYLITPNSTVMTGQTRQIFDSNRDGQLTAVDLNVDIKSGSPVNTVISIDPELQEKWIMLWANDLRGEGMRALPELAAAAQAETLTAPQGDISTPLQPAHRFAGALNALSGFADYLPSLSSLPTLSIPQLTLPHVDNLLTPFVLAVSFDLVRGRSPSLSTAAFAGLFSLVQGAWGQMENGPYFLKSFNLSVDGGGSSLSIMMNDSGLVVPGYVVRNVTRSNAFLLQRFDAFGNLLWSTSYDGTNTEAFKGAFVASNGDLYVGGYTYSPPTVGLSDAVLAIFNATNGRMNQMWTLGGILKDGLSAISSRDTGGFFFLGVSNYTTEDSNSDVLFGAVNEYNELVCLIMFGGSKYEFGFHLSTVRGYGTIIGGVTASFDAGQEREIAFIARVNETCALKQAVSINFGPIGSYGYVNIVHVDNNIGYAIGDTDHRTGNEEGFILKFDVITFDIQQSNSFAIAGAKTSLFSTQLVNDGEILIVGSTDRGGYWRPLYAKLDPTFRLLWATIGDDVRSRRAYGASIFPMDKGDILTAVDAYHDPGYSLQFIRLNENGVISGCPYAVSIKDNVTIIPITPNVTNVTSLLQVTPLNYTLRPRNVTFTHQYPSAETLCEYFPPTTVTETLLAVLSSNAFSPGSSFRWILFASGGGLIAICCLAGSSCIAVYMLRRGKWDKHAADEEGKDADLSSSNGHDDAIVTALPAIPTSASSVKSKHKPKGDQPQEEPYHNTHDVNKPCPPGEYNNLPGAETLASAGFMSGRKKKSGPYVKCFVDPGGEGDEYANFPHGEQYANAPNFT